MGFQGVDSGFITPEQPPSRESNGDFFMGLVVGLGLATVFWVAFAIVLWLILR